MHAFVAILRRLFQLSLLIFVTVAEAQVIAPRVSPNAPRDVEIPAGFMNDPVFFFDDFSWRTFVSINWPALADRRGEPDTGKAFGADSDKIVWGSWKADHEIFQPNGMEPSEWKSFNAQSPDRFTPFANAGKVKVLGGFGFRGSDLQIEHFNQAGIAGNNQGSLVGANRRYIRYEVRINKPEFDFIRDGKFYLASKLPATGQLVFPEGSGEIKAAWRVFTESEAMNAQLLNRYYNVEAVLVDPDGATTRSRIGLIGLHIVRRTPSRPEWIWSSFEHVDNLAQSDSSLLVSNGPGPNENKLHPPVVKVQDLIADPDPVPVRRLRPIRDETKDVNAAWQSNAAIAGTVWKNYQLVLTQWPQTPAATEPEFVQRFTTAYPGGAGTPSPRDNNNAASIANVTMETTPLFQQAVSCMQCHFNAGKLKHTEFVWTVPLRAFRDSPIDIDNLRQELRNHVKSLTDAAEASLKK